MFIPYAFIPFGILLGTALIGAALSTWIGLSARPAARRQAEILYFPISDQARTSVHRLAPQSYRRQV
jgi:hypothetical protein